MSEPCGWAVAQCACGTCWTRYSPEVRAAASALAIGVMWAATARRYGQCTLLVEPCNRPPLLRDYQVYPQMYAGYGTAYIDQGVWHNSCTGSFGQSGDYESSSCCKGCEVPLEGPTDTDSVLEVTVAGVVIPPASYMIQNRYLLVRTDKLCWPICTNYSEQSPPGFTVEYLRGEPIPARVQAATERLACEFARACAGGNCALPRRMTRLTRQGVDLEVEALSSDPGKLRTGIPEVDLIIGLENPGGRSMRSVVLSPDTTPARVMS
jgi:hypothetical protein